MTDEEKKEEVVEEATADEAKVDETPATEETTEATPVEEVKAEEPKAEVKEEKPAKDVPAKFKDLVKTIEELSVLELAELVKVLEDKFGVSAAAPVAMMAGGAAGAPAEAAEEKTSFDVVLAAAGAQKINVIKAVREIKPELGLVEAKNLVEGAPKEVLKGAKKEDAESAKAKLEAAGATVELK